MSTTVLQLAISMIFLYLMLSAASSAIQEIIANFFRWRAKTLEKGIEGLFNEDFKDAFYKRPLITSLCSPNARGDLTHRPSYIAPATFALAVLDLAAEKQMNLSGAVFSPPVVASPPDPFSKAEELLRSVLLGASTVEEQRRRIETWFNDSMDRVSGWYKRKAHLCLWIIGIILCLVVNADSIKLGLAFWNDEALRTAIVGAATQYVKDAKDKTSLAKPKTAQSPNPQPGASTAGNQPPATGTDTADQNQGSGDTALQRLNKVRQDLAETSIPLGWCTASRVDSKWELSCWPKLSTKSDSTKIQYDELPADPRLVPPCGLDWLWKVLGIAVTALAISQGAPFWFDLLQKAVNLRLAGDAPDEKKQKK